MHVCLHVDFAIVLPCVRQLSLNAMQHQKFNIIVQQSTAKAAYMNLPHHPHAPRRVNDSCVRIVNNCLRWR